MTYVHILENNFDPMNVPLIPFTVNEFCPLLSFRTTTITYLASCLLRHIILRTKIFGGYTCSMYNCALWPQLPYLRNKIVA